MTESENSKVRRLSLTLPLTSDDDTPDFEHSRPNQRFSAGATQFCQKQWAKLTSNRLILQAVNAGVSLEFDALPTQWGKLTPLNFSAHDFDIIDNQVVQFLKLGIIERTVHSPRAFISNIFIREKRDGSHRLILNLVELNPFIAYHHFKMDTVETVISLMRKDCFMASVDLSNAYYSVPIAESQTVSEI